MLPKAMRILMVIILFNLFVRGFSQDFKEKDVVSEIKEVTVFLNGAQIAESSLITIPVGKTILKVKNLSPYLDEKSIRVSAEGDFTILSVNHKLNYLDALTKSEKLDSLEKVREKFESTISHDNARLDVMKEKLNLLNANKNIGNQNSGTTMIQLKQALDFFESEVTKIKEEELKINKSIEAKRLEISKLNQQLKQMNELNSLPSSEIEIRVSCDRPITTKLGITYLVANAGWFPKYDIRVENIISPLDLTYKAEVFQNTGKDWKDVKLRFSNGDPNQSGLVPQLNTWNLTYARNTIFENGFFGSANASSIRTVRGTVHNSQDGTPIAGVNVLVKGTTIGTVTDINGTYSLTLPNNASTLVFSFIGFANQEAQITTPEINIKLQPDVAQLSEVVVVGYGSDEALQGRVAGVQLRGKNSFDKSIPTSVRENQTTVEFEVTTPYSIKSSGEKLQVDLRKFKIDAAYEFYAIPKLDKDAFLIANIVNWDQYNLLEGEANLYFEDAYVGRSILEAKALSDTLTISLGRDKNILIAREKNDQFSKKRTLASSVVETRNFKITARNKKSQAIKLTIVDQIPVSIVSDIIVNPLELSKGELDTKSGKVTWRLEIAGQQQKDINLQYEVRYPKKEKIILE